MKFLLLVLLATLCGAGLFLMAGRSEPKPVRVVILQDLPRNATSNGFPMLSEADFNQITTLISNHGGELAFGVITDKDSPLARIELARSDDPYKKKDLQARIVGFRNAVVDRLSTTHSNRSDLAAALDRAATVFNEVSAGQAMQYLILISDGVPDASPQPPPALAVNAITLTVSGRQKPNLSGAQHFESIAAAIRFIEQKTR